MEHQLVVGANPSMEGELLEELVAVLEVYLLKLFPLRILQLCIGILPEPCGEGYFEVLIVRVELFPRWRCS